MKNLVLIIVLTLLYSCNEHSEKSITPISNTEYAYLTEELSNEKKIKKDSLNIDFQLRGFLHAFSNPRNAVKPNGEYQSDNIPKKIDRAFPKEKILLVISDKEYSLFQDEYLGHKLYLVNSTNSKVDFLAQDSRLDILIEALDKRGKWKPVSFLPSSSCGNSYHNVTLGENEYWEFSIPVFSGDYKTKIRYSVVLDNETNLVSNEILAYMNLGQLDKNRQQGYITENIMDPYSN